MQVSLIGIPLLGYLLFQCLSERPEDDQYGEDESSAGPSLLRHDVDIKTHAGSPSDVNCILIRRNGEIVKSSDGIVASLQSEGQGCCCGWYKKGETNGTSGVLLWMVQEGR